MSLPSRIDVPIPKDGQGDIGRECPVKSFEDTLNQAWHRLERKRLAMSLPVLLAH
jgi:hypothetical protein